MMNTYRVLASIDMLGTKALKVLYKIAAFCTKLAKEYRTPSLFEQEEIVLHNKWARSALLLSDNAFIAMQ